jgi:O-antigen ligase
MALLYRRRGGAVVLAIPLIVAVTLGIVTSQARVVVVGSIISVIAFLVMTTSARRWFGALAAAAITATVAFLVVGSLTGSTHNSFDRYENIAPSEVLRTTYDYRKDTVANVGRYATSFPLGAGLGTVGPGSSTAGGNGRALDGESEYTFLLVETGIPGLLVLAGFNVLLLTLVFRRLRTIADRDTQVLLAAIAAPMFALVTSWVVGASTASTPGSPYMWFAAGILVYWLHDATPRQTSASS